MNNKTKHTPTPWDREVVEGIWMQGVDKLFADGKIGAEAVVAIVNGTAKEDAAHIVKCVNMHDELVEALKDIIDRSHNDPLGTSKVLDMRKIAEKSLKKAGAL